MNYFVIQSRDLSRDGSGLKFDEQPAQYCSRVHSKKPKNLNIKHLSGIKTVLQILPFVQAESSR